MIVNKDITEFLSDRILASSEVDYYCQNNFHKSLMVFVGVDVNNPPQIKTLPALIIEPTVKNIGEKASSFDYEMAISIGIEGKDEPTIDGNKVLYDGVYKIEELGDLIVELIKNEFSLHTNMDTYDVTFYQDEINAFPTYSGVVLVSFSVPNAIGENKLTFSC